MRRSQLRTGAILLLTAVLVAVFFYGVDVRRVVTEIARADPLWLAASLASMFANLALRARRWQYLLAPVGRTTFAHAFRATAVGFAANTVLPARAGEVIRPYFLARHQQMSATGAFATILLERLIDTLTVVLLLAAYLFVFGRDQTAANPVAFAAAKWAGAGAGLTALVALVVAFFLARDPAGLRRAIDRLTSRVPSALAAKLSGVVERFANGFGTVRRPIELLGALAWSLPLWLTIAFGIWAVTVAFHFTVPYTGSFFLVSLLVIGVAVPTPGAVGGFHEAFRLGTTVFFGAPQAAAVGSAIVLHAFSVAPSLVLGLIFAAQQGLSLGGVRRLADEGRSPDTTS